MNGSHRLDVAAPGATATAGGRRYVFCSPGCAERFAADPPVYDASLAPRPPTSAPS